MPNTSCEIVESLFNHAAAPAPSRKALAIFRGSFSHPGEMSDDLTEGQTAVVPDGFVINLWQRGFGRTVGPFYSSRDPATNIEVMAFRVEEHHANGMNNCHGGMLMSFADMAWGRVISNQREVGWVTIRLVTDFIGPGLMGYWVEGTSEIIAEDGDIFTVAGRVWSGERVLMTGTGVYKGIRSIRRKAGYREAKE